MNVSHATPQATKDPLAVVLPAVSIEPRDEPRCKICRAADKDLPNGAAVRNLVDRLLMVPTPYPEVVRMLSPLMDQWPEGAQPSEFSVRRHAQRHLKWEEAAFRAIADRRADKIAQVAEASERMIDATIVLETVHQRGLDLLLQDEIRPNVKDLLAASSALQELEERAAGTVSPAVLLSQLDRVIQIIREEIPEDRWPDVVARLEGRDADMTPPDVDTTFNELMAEMDP
jgi:hypothetical protein